MTIRKIALGSLLLTLLCACDDASRNAGADGEVEFTATSPDAVVRASIVREGFGATVPYVYSVRISHGKDQPGAELLRADHVDNPKLRWRDARNLEITMDCGRIFSYTNFYTVLDARTKAYLFTINVKLANSTLCTT